MKKKKMNLDELKVQSFVTELNGENGGTDALQGGFTGDCGTPINVTCANGCDFQSIPFDECPTMVGCATGSQHVCSITRC